MNESDSVQTISPIVFAKEPAPPSRRSKSAQRCQCNIRTIRPVLGIIRGSRQSGADAAFISDARRFADGRNRQARLLMGR